MRVRMSHSLSALIPRLRMNRMLANPLDQELHWVISCALCGWLRTHRRRATRREGNDRSRKEADP